MLSEVKNNLKIMMELKQSLHAIMKLNQSNKHSSMAVIMRKLQGLSGLLFMCCVVWIISKFFSNRYHDHDSPWLIFKNQI